MRASTLTVPSAALPGSTVGIVFPSAALSPKAMHRLEQAVRMLHELEYDVRLGTRVADDGLPDSAHIATRVDDLHDMFRDSQVSCVLTGIGGNTANQLLPFLDFDLIAGHPKAFVGYSDITVLHYALAARAGLATFYGPCAITQFGEFPEVLPYTSTWFLRQVGPPSRQPRQLVPSDAWTDEFLDWFQRADQTRARHGVDNAGYRWVRRGESQGWLLAGCLGSLNRLAGTRYWIDPEGSVLFLDVLAGAGGDVVGRTDAALTDLANLGVFDSIVGLAVGRLAGFDSAGEQHIVDRIAELTAGNDLPVVIGLDIGHTDPIATLRYGQEVWIARDGTITIGA